MEGVEFFYREGQAISATLDEEAQVQQAAQVDWAFVATLSDEYGRLIEE